ncbi:hypothetical protein KDX24_23255 [Pseudomonas sp. CDFA 550]|nr:hypothetical protein [Pseudomonas quasicaspiana]
MRKPPRRLSRTPLTLCLLSLLLSGTATADERFIIGVATHLMNKNGLSAKVLQLLEAAGVDSVRDDAWWPIAEPHYGQLQIDPAWQAYLNRTQKYKLRPLLVLNDSNANYVSFVSGNLADRVDFYEIGNEWDEENPVDLAIARDYSNLIEQTANTLRQRKNPVTILASAVTTQGMEAGFADRLVTAGLLDHVDGLSLHPYAYCRQDGQHTPERWIAWLRWIDADLRARVARPVPLYLTEMGWHGNSDKCGVSEQAQAAWLARSFFLALTVPDIKGLWWYDLLDDGKDPGAPEQRSGLLNQDLTVKPSYLTLKAISPFLHDYRYDAEKSRELDSVYLLRFAKGSEQILVAWSTGPPRLIAVDASSVQAGNVLLTDSGQPERGQHDSGVPWNCNDSRCSAQVPINEFPKIIRLGSKPPLFAR